MHETNIKKTFDIKRLHSILTPEERTLYKKILDDIGKNQYFYTSSSPEEITDYLINKCGFQKEKVYTLFKKIDSINREWIEDDRICQEEWLPHQYN